MNGVPVIRIEIDHMKHAIVHAMSAHFAAMDADVQAAVDAICTPERIREIVYQQAQVEIKRAIESEISSFYSYGDGRQAVREAVGKALQERGKALGEY